MCRWWWLHSQLDFHEVNACFSSLSPTHARGGLPYCSLCLQTVVRSQICHDISPMGAHCMSSHPCCQESTCGVNEIAESKIKLELQKTPRGRAMSTALEPKPVALVQNIPINDKFIRVTSYTVSLVNQDYLPNLWLSPPHQRRLCLIHKQRIPADSHHFTIRLLDLKPCRKGTNIPV